MHQDERKAVLEAMRWVDEVQITTHPENPTDMSVCAELKKTRPDIFAQGGDRNVKNIPPCEVELQKTIGFKVVENVGRSGKIQSSSWLLEEYVKKAKG